MIPNDGGGNTDTTNVDASATSSDGGDAGPPNTPPTITAFQDQTVTAGSATSALEFDVADAEDNAAALVVSAAVTLTPGLDATFAFSGTGGKRALVVTPGIAGVRQVTVTVTVSGGATATRSFFLTANAADGVNPIVTTEAESGSGSLKDIIAAVAPNTIITFSTAIDKKPIVWGGGGVALAKPVSIIGHGADVTVISTADYHFAISSEVKLIGLSLYGASASSIAVNTTGNLTMDRCYLGSNQGTATLFAEGPVTITNSFFIQNKAVTVLLIKGTAAMLRNNTFAENTASCAIMAYSYPSSNVDIVVDIVNTTISLPGGGAYGIASYDNAKVRVSYSTIVGTPDGTVAVATNADGSLVIRNSAIYRHKYNYNGYAPDSVGNYELANGADADLGSLEAHGGFMPTLLPPLALRDSGPVGPCLDATGAPVLTDQRGFPRPSGQKCDLGAIERQPTDP